MINFDQLAKLASFFFPFFFSFSFLGSFECGQCLYLYASFSSTITPLIYLFMCLLGTDCCFLVALPVMRAATALKVLH